MLTFNKCTMSFGNYFQSLTLRPCLLIYLSSTLLDYVRFYKARSSRLHMSVSYSYISLILL